jgi:hypothetical protein
MTGEEIEFTVETAESNLEYTWQVNDLQVGSGSSLSQKFTEDGKYDVQVEIADSQGQITEQEWNVVIDNFKQSPSIDDQSTAKTLTPNDDTEIVTFSFHHPEVNDQDVVVEIRAETPDGIIISGTRDVRETDGAQSITVGSVSPGETEDMALQIEVKDDSLVGQTVNFNYEVVYYSEDSPENVIEVEEQDLYIDVSGESKEKKSVDSLIGAVEEQPGFGFMSVVPVLFGAIFILYCRIKRLG